MHYSALICTTIICNVFTLCHHTTFIFHLPNRNPASLPTKLLCFTRSSPLIHQLPAQHPNSVFEAQTSKDSWQTLHDLVFPNPSKLVVCKLSSLLSQSSVQELLREFVQTNTNQVSFSAWNNVAYNLLYCLNNMLTSTRSSSKN